jgi:hypothetical protein
MGQVFLWIKNVIKYKLGAMVIWQETIRASPDA